MLSVRFEKEHHCVCAYDEGRKIGECTFRLVAGDWVIDHTYVEDAYRDRGLAAKMVDLLAEEAQKAGAGLLASCSYARERLSQKNKACGKEKERQADGDLLDLLVRVPGKVSDLQDEIDRMNRKKKS